MAIGTAACTKEVVVIESVVRPVKILKVGALEARMAEFPGSIAAAQHAEMAFEVPGRIVEFLVDQGDRVKRGDILARLDNRDYQARLDSATASLNKALADDRRGKSLYRQDPGAIAQVTLDSYASALDTARANHDQAQKAFEDTILRAPFDGRIGRKRVEDFANVRAKQPVLTLQDDAHLEIDIAIPERDIVFGLPGRSPEEVTRELNPKVVVSALPDRSFPARAKSIAAMADPVTRTFTATLSFERPTDVEVLPGMTAKVVFRREGEVSSAIRIPIEAVLSDGTSAPIVWVVDLQSMTVKERPVELGDLVGSEVEIRSGLESGESIAAAGVHYLREGMQVGRFEG